MTNEVVFINASRYKYRFPSDKGLLTVEDLWDLPLTKLDSTYKKVCAQLNEIEKIKEETLIPKTNYTKESDTLVYELKCKKEILVHIANVKTKEKQDKEEALSKAQQRANIEKLIAEKKEENLKNLSVEELEALAKNL